MISVIIPVWNDAVRLRLCLQGLAMQNYPSSQFEVIVVDNGSTDNCQQVVSQFCGVKYLQQPAVGSYAARNRGLEAAVGEILAFTDADCVPLPNWLEHSVLLLRANPEVPVLAGHVDLLPDNPQAITLLERHQLAYSFNQRRCVRLNYSTTANLIARRQVFQAVGPFCSELKSMGDYEWGRRAAAAGFLPRYAPEVRVQHPTRRAFGQLIRRNQRLAGGEFLIYRSQGRSRSATLWKIATGLFQRRAYARTEPVQRWQHRICVDLVEALLRGVRFVEALRLVAGGQPRRE